MTDNELKFYDPETGKPLPRVPKGAPIPAYATYGYIRRDGSRGWADGGVERAFDQPRDVTYFTREPIAPPKPLLPTEPGSTIRAAHQRGDECAVMTRGKAGSWHGIDQTGHLRYWRDWQLREWEPVAIVPTETWDRLRALDPEDKRDRVDANGVTWTREGGGWLPDAKSAALRCYLSLENIPGPLRFVDEASNNE